MRILDFETSIFDLEQKIADVKAISDGDSDNLAKEIKRLEGQLQKQITRLYGRLSPWQRVQIARHESRPHTLDFIRILIDDFQPLKGDRSYAEDASIVTGIGRLNGTAVAIIGQERGHNVETRLHHRFGMPFPEGYRKAQRIFKLADRFCLPVLTFVDTPGADPGIESEQRGQAEAIASCIRCCLTVKVPVIVTIIGEGGSGGAVAIAVGNHIQMLSNAIYTVISPEGCSAILWRDGEHSALAAEMLRISAPELLGMGLIDQVIEEPMGGAHRHVTTVVKATGKAIEEQLAKLAAMSGDELIKRRHDKFLSMDLGVKASAKKAPVESSASLAETNT